MTDVQTTITDAIRSIRGDWADLTAVYVAGGNVTGGANTQQLPGGTARLNLIADAHTLVTQYVALVLDERDLAGNTGLGTVDRLNYLETHAEWLAGHEVGADCANELADLASRIRSLVAPSGIRRIPIGACPVDDCGGVVRALLLKDGQDHDPDLYCDIEREHSWTRERYAHLARMLGTDGPDRLTVDEFVEFIAARFRRQLNTATVRTWIHRHPLSMGWDAPTKTVDRIEATKHYLERRSARAAA